MPAPDASPSSSGAGRRFRVALAVTLGLLVVLAVTGLLLTWAYHPEPDASTSLRVAHRVASALLMPASWALAFTMVQARWGAGRRSHAARWAVPVLMVLAVPAAAFTGFLLPWEEAVVPAAVVPPALRGVGVAFDAGVSTVSFGADPISRAAYQRYVLAHFFLGALVTGLVLLIARTAARRPR